MRGLEVATALPSGKLTIIPLEINVVLELTRTPADFRLTAIAQATCLAILTRRPQHFVAVKLDLPNRRAVV